MKCQLCENDLSKIDHFKLVKSKLCFADDKEPTEYPFIKEGEPYFIDSETQLLFCDVVCLWKWCESDGKFESILQLETGAVGCGAVCIHGHNELTCEECNKEG